MAVDHPLVADFVPAGISATLGIALTLQLVLSIRTDAPAFWFSQPVSGGSFGARPRVISR
ncbi:MAG TPA: hypothetical protein VIP52_11570 [Candidatus Dormibacteraeota bacterium]